MDFMRQTLETPHKGEVRLSGGFRTNGGSAPTVLYGNWIESVSHDSAGVYTVTFKRAFRYLDCYGKQVSLQLAAAGDSKAQFGAYSKSAGTLVVRTITGAAAADIASDPDNIVWIELVMRYGNVPDGGPNYDS